MPRLHRFESRLVCGPERQAHCVLVRIKITLLLLFANPAPREATTLTARLATRTRTSLHLPERQQAPTARSAAGPRAALVPSSTTIPRGLRRTASPPARAQARARPRRRPRILDQAAAAAEAVQPMSAPLPAAQLAVLWPWLSSAPGCSCCCGARRAISHPAQPCRPPTCPKPTVRPRRSSSSKDTRHLRCRLTPKEATTTQATCTTALRSRHTRRRSKDMDNTLNSNNTGSTRSSKDILATGPLLQHRRCIPRPAPTQLAQRQERLLALAGHRRSWRQFNQWEMRTTELSWEDIKPLGGEIVKYPRAYRCPMACSRKVIVYIRDGGGIISKLEIKI